MSALTVHDDHVPVAGDQIVVEERPLIFFLKTRFFQSNRVA